MLCGLLLPALARALLEKRFLISMSFLWFNLQKNTKISRLEAQLFG